MFHMLLKIICILLLLDTMFYIYILTYTCVCVVCVYVCVCVCMCMHYRLPYIGASVEKNLPAITKHRRHGFDPQVRKIPCKRAWQSTPVFSLGKSHEQRKLRGYSPWGLKRIEHNLMTNNNYIYAYAYVCVCVYIYIMNPCSLMCHFISVFLLIFCLHDLTCSDH